LFFLWGINHKNIYETPHDSSKPVIFVFNHISYMDAMVILIAIRNQAIRGLGKVEISKIPLLGFMYKHAVIMVKRDDAEDRARSVADLKAAINDNISIILAPEGTFNMTTKPLTRFYDGAFRIAIQTQTPIKPLLFLDTYDRLNYNSLFSVKPGKSRVVYLDEVSVEGYTIDDVAALRQKVYDIMEAALIRYNASWIKE
jgi:1-acyl-sn-glycerol-3-phosphate acyltransferase